MSMRVAALSTVMAALPLVALAGDSRTDAPAVAACLRKADAAAWLTPETAPDFSELRYYALPATDFFEVGASKLEVAINELSEKSIVPLDELLLAELCGSSYRPTEGKKPYLVRAVYGNTLVPFSVFSRKGKLVVLHAGMRAGERWFRKSALIVTLPETPNSLQVVADVASPH